MKLMGLMVQRHKCVQLHFRSFPTVTIFLSGRWTPCRKWGCWIIRWQLLSVRCNCISTQRYYIFLHLPSTYHDQSLWRRSRVNYYAWRFCTSSCTTASIYHRSVGRSKWRKGDSSPISLHIYEIACSEEDRWQWCIELWVRWNNFNKTIRLEHISFYYLCLGIFLSPAVFIPKSVTRRYKFFNWHVKSWQFQAVSLQT